ncbi:MAG: hypothetical protein F4X87_03555 [Chloroflexi bacterium]|nr:hypothetical protein [Chloroflexota bacterium]
MGRRLVVLLLLLVLGAAALPAVQARGFDMYIYMYGHSSNIHEGQSWKAKFSVARTSLGGSYRQDAQFRICFSGSATLGTDYFVRSTFHGNNMRTNGNCFTDTFNKGYQTYYYYIVPIEDSDDEQNETLIATLSQAPGNPWPSGYYMPSSHSKATFRIIDND